MKHLLRTALCCLLVLVFASARAEDPSRFSKIQTAFTRANDKTVLVVAHRGAHTHAPENSLAAIRAAIHMGVDIVELDLRKTRDGHLVIMHDVTVNRTTNGHGVVGAMTLAAIRKLRLRMPDGTLTDERVPTLEEVSETVRGKCMVYLDRSFPHLDDALAVLVRTKTVDHFIFRGPGSHDEAKRALERHRVKFLYMPQAYSAAAAKRWTEKAQPPVIAIFFAFTGAPVARAQTIRAIRDAGARVFVSTMFHAECGGLTDHKARRDPAAAWGPLVDRGVNIIQTDEPERLLQYLRKRKLRRTP